MFGSNRMWPFCMSASDTPIARTILCSSKAKARTSPAPARSGSVTISMSGVPARFRSTWEKSPVAWRFLPASSSRCTLRIRIRLVRPVERGISMNPFSASGRSYWLIW